MSKADEMILVVPRNLFDEIGSFQGLNFEVDRYLPAFLSRQNNSFKARSQAETDPGFKQLIPYAILVQNGRILHYVRGKKGGESRLHAKGSIGIGGHMNDHDEGLFALDADAYHAGVRRELQEELRINGPFKESIVALLNDDSNEVGQVHLGIVHVFTLGEGTVESNDTAITALEFLSPEELHARRDKLETWSQICVDHLEELLGRSQR
jgi:predicted NUDIX family phosphoesterase